MGLAGFPAGFWLVLELLVEVIVLFDFFLRIYLKHRMPNQWTTMWLLQQREKNSGPVHLSLSFVASIPQSMIYCIIFRGNMEKLSYIVIAELRLLKLMKFHHIQKFFETKFIEDQVNGKANSGNI